VEAQLSKVYTNHSLRASSVHLLDSANVPTHIMAVTGHKAESSLKTYTGYTDQNTKKLMSHTISRGFGLDPVKENTHPWTIFLLIGAYLEKFLDLSSRILGSSSWIMTSTLLMTLIQFLPDSQKVFRY